MNNALKPKFDPEKEYTVLGKPPFDPNQPFEPAPLLKEPEPPKPLTETEILSLIRSELSRIQPQVINRIVERVEIREPEKKETRKFVEESSIDELKKEIERLKKKLAKVQEVAENPMIIPGPGGSGVIGIPPPESATENDVLTVVNKKAKWKAGGGGSGLTGMSASNAEEVLSFDADDTSIDELANVVATIIDQLS